MLTIYIFVPVTNGQVISCITFFITKCDSNKKIVAETKKLESNSSYGRTVTNKERHADVLYCQEQQVSRHLMDSSFRRCNQLDEKTFELEMSKKTIRLDLPMQIGFFVYQYAKLRCYSSTTTLWTSLWIVEISSTVPWTQIVLIWLCPLSVWKK